MRESERKTIPGTDYEMDRSGQVFKKTTSPGYPKGFQKKPTLHKGAIRYSFESGIVFKSLQEFYFQLFDCWPNFELDEYFYRNIVQAADDNNRELKGVRGYTKKKAAIKGAVQRIKPEPMRRIHSEPKTKIHDLGSLSGYTAMIGFESGVPAGFNFASFCPLG